MPTARKVLMLGLDSASPELLTQWTSDGTLPHLAQLARDAVTFTVAGPEGLEIGSTWPTFYTGQPPGEHGMCWINRVIPGTYREQRMNARDFLDLRPFWEDLSEAGRRVAILDVPFAPLSSRCHGVQVSEWGAHDGVSGLRTRPARLGRELLREWGPHPAPLMCETPRLSERGYRELADTHVRGTRLRGSLTRSLLESERWDFAIQVFTEVHCAGHLFWHYHDPTHPSATPEALAQNGDLLREVYVATDDAIGEILSVVDADTVVIVGSLHGMQHVCGSSLLLPKMLAGLGLLQPAGPAHARPAVSRRSGGVKGLMRSAWHRVPAGVRRPLYEWRQQLNTGVLHRGSPIGIDPTATRAFQMGFGAGATFSGIRLNLKGRESAGLVSPGGEVEELTAQIREGLAEFTDLETGRPLVRRVIRTDERYPGRRLSDLPDLLVEWAYDPPRGSMEIGTGAGGLWRGYSDRVGEIEHRNGSGRSGAHRLPGLMYVRAPGIPATTIGRTISTLDLPPTIAALLDCELRRSSGKPIAELCRDA